MLFSAVGGYNLPLFQFSTALRLAIATASPFVSMFPCHPALWVMEKSRHSILSPHLSTGDEHTISSSCLCGDWTQTPASYAFRALGDTESYRDLSSLSSFSLFLPSSSLATGIDISSHISIPLWVGGEQVEGSSNSSLPGGHEEESPASFLLHLRYCDLFLF